MIKVTCEVPLKDKPPEDNPLIVQSHWTNDDLVIIRFGEYVFSVVAKDLLVAVENAQRSAKD